MADLADIEKALVSLLASVLFPGATYRPGAVATSGSIPVRLYRGWPTANELDADIAAGRCNVTVYPGAGMVRDATRYKPEWFTPEPAAPSLTVATFSNKITFAGTGGAGQVAAVTWEGQIETVRLTANDTPTTVAATLAARFSGATSSGGVLTLPNDAEIVASVVADQTAMREVRRQEQGFTLTVWAPTPDARDTIAGAIDGGLAAIPSGEGVTQFITLDNGERARVQYRGGRTEDRTSKAAIWRRDLSYVVEYATIQTATQAQVAAAGTSLRTGANSLIGGFRDTPIIGAIRYDAWYSGNALTLAEAAALSPSQFNYRLPFFSTVSGSATIDGNHQAVMDAECAAALTAKLDYWAFLGWPTGADELNARNLYLASTAAKPRFCLIEQFSNLGYQGLIQPEVDDAVAMTAHASYQRVMGRPLMFFFATSEADIATRFGSHAGLAVVIANMRSRITAAAGANPYFVVQDPSPERAARLARECGFDAIGAYALPAGVQAPTAYSALAANTAASWGAYAGFGLDVVPPAMTGWNPTPRAITPNAYFGAEANGSLQTYYQDGTASAIAAHVAAMKAWLKVNRAAAPMQSGLVYAWNEFSEGGWLCPTHSAGNPAGDTSRVAALASALA